MVSILNILEYINLNDACHMYYDTDSIDTDTSFNYIRSYCNNNYGYITLPVFWACMQFKITINNLYVRHKWGNQSWTSFKQIY